MGGISRYLKQDELLDRLDVLLGGGAEQLIYRQVSTGAQDNLQRATDLARQMVVRYGMSDALGAVTFESARPALYLPEAAAPPRAEFRRPRQSMRRCRSS